MKLSLIPPFRVVAGILALTFLPIPAMASDLAALLPKESMLFAEIRSVPDLLKAMNQPLARSLRASGLDSMLDQLTGNSDLGLPDDPQTATGLTTAEWIAKFTGPLAMGGGALEDEKTADAGSGEKSAVLFVADFTGDEALLEKLFKAGAKRKIALNTPNPGKETEGGSKKAAKKPSAVFPEQYEETITETEGGKLHVWSLKDPEKTHGQSMSWALAGGRAFVCLGEEVALKDALRRQLKKITDEGLSKAPFYRDVEKAAGENRDLLGGMDMKRIMELGSSQMVADANKKGLVSQLMAQVRLAWKATGLDQLRTAFAAGDLREQGIHLDFGVDYTQKPELLKLYSAKGPGELPDFLPQDVPTALWGTLNGGDSFGTLAKLMEALNPGQGEMMNASLDAMKNFNGVDLRRDIFDRLGDNWWMVSGEDAAAEKAKTIAAGDANSGKVLGIALRDRQAFELSLKSIFNAVAPGEALFEDKDYLGNTIHRMKSAPAGWEISWLIKNDTLLLSFGKTGLLEQLLASMEKKPAAPLLEQNAVKAAFAAMPGNQVGAAYHDAGAFLSDLRTRMQTRMAAFGMENDFTKAPGKLTEKPDLPYFIASRLYISEKSTQVRIRLAPKP